ncbi:MAG TPA: tripartite tricarboxylate transporter substrate binding protein [Xanthobacteraceae bacterium]|jgi:tripartite-type tricarboxylate transporter receptor subunit TctC|nr:tripartite tricarboxylate transporter substrate binding protein [Xanthobacteraceae bacterium]
MPMSPARFALPIAAILGALTGPAIAQNYPTGPITLVNPYAAGGPADSLSRIIMEPMPALLGQPLVLVNKPGGATAIAAASVATAPKDGYTLLLSNASSHIVTPLLAKVNYDGIKDFEFICMIASVPNVLVVREGLPAKSVKELVELAKAKPGTITYASVGNGSFPHIAGELFQQMTGTKLNHVPYRGAAPATVDLLSGQIDMGILNAPPLLEHIKTGKLRGLGIASLKRSEQLPDVATLDELGLKGFNVVTWYAIAAPTGTPKPIVDKIADAFQKALAMPDVKSKLALQGVETFYLSPKEYVAYLGTEAKTLADVIKTANIKAD